MKVAVLIKTNEGGLWIIPHVRALMAAGHEVAVVLPAGDGKLRRALDAQGINLLESAFTFEFTPSWRTVRGLVALRRQLAAWQPDVLVYHLYASALAGRMATWGTGTRRVHMVPGPLYLDSPLIARIEGFMQALDHHLVAGSDYTLRRYEGLTGVSSLNRSVIPYGVDTSRFIPTTPEARRGARDRLGIPEDDFVAVIVAYVYEPKTMAGYRTGIKGHDTLIEAWDRFSADKEGVHLVIVGGGFDEPGEQYRQQLMAQYPGRGIVWAGKVDDVAGWYAAADVSVSPSLSENHGAAVEASALGLPSIVSDAGGLPETVSGESGWVFPRGEAVALASRLEDAHAAHSSGRLPAMGRSARQRMEEEFDSSRAAASLTKVVETQGPARRPVVTLFTEARFVVGMAGILSVDGANGDSQWSRYSSLDTELNVAGRSTARDRGQSGGEPVTAARVIALPSYEGISGLLHTVPSLVRAIDDAVRRSDAVVCRVPGPIGTMAAASARLRGIPYATEMVGDPLDVLQSGAVGRVGELLARGSAMITRWVVRGASAARYVTRETLQRTYPPQPDAGAWAIPNVRIPAETMRLEPRRAPHDIAVLIAVGSQETTYKGHDVAIRALATLRAWDVPARLVLVGGGRHHEELRVHAARCGVSDLVDFKGPLSRDAVWEELRRSDILVHPSRTEGLPRVVLEAMAQGLPVVATRVGGIPELLPDTCLVERDDDQEMAATVAGILGDKEMYSMLSQGSLTMVAGYTQNVVDAAFGGWVNAVNELAKAPSSA
ncbi:glycosyltransferase [Kytococcus sedentarius]|uniref:glycosyltransferase n=1 Tax=Kytococcus sedentarius TaxID=1276 RepID=UPI00384DB5FF